MINLNKNQKDIYNKIAEMLGEKYEEGRDSINVSIMAYHIDLINICTKTLEELGSLVFIAESSYRQKYAEVSLIESSFKELTKLGALYGLSLRDQQKLNDLASKDVYDAFDDDL